MASTKPAVGSAEQPAKNNAEQSAGSSAGQPVGHSGPLWDGPLGATKSSCLDGPLWDTADIHTPDYPDMCISLLPTIGELHHYHQPVVAYHRNYIHPVKIFRPAAARPVCARSIQHVGLLAKPPPPRPPGKHPPPLPPCRTPTDPWGHTFVYPQFLREAIQGYDFSPYWRAPTVTVNNALTGDFVCTLGPEFWMLSLCNYGTVIDAERYVSGQLRQAVRVAYIGTAIAPDDTRHIAEILAREKTNTVVVQPVPLTTGPY